VGGGLKNSLSLLESTHLCEQITGKKIPIHRRPETRVADVPLYISDHRKITGLCGWRPSWGPKQTLSDIYYWIRENESLVRATLTS
jgi:CDP-paratose 2-epimerase